MFTDKPMKLAAWARAKGVDRLTAWNWAKNGKITTKSDGGRLWVFDDPLTTVVYARSPAAGGSCQSQVEECLILCADRGWKVSSVMEDVGGPDDERRPKLLALLSRRGVRVVAWSRSAVACPGFLWVKAAVENAGGELVLVST